MQEEIYRYLLYLFSQFNPLLNTYAVKELKQKFKLSRFQIYRLIQELEEMKVIERKPLNKRVFEILLTDPKKLLDLMSSPHTRNISTPNTEELNSTDKQQLLRHARQLLKPSHRRGHSAWKDAINKYALKPILKEEDKEELSALFELYLDDINEKLILLKSETNELLLLHYKTRFTSKHEAIDRLIKAEESFNLAKSLYTNAVFLTLTLPTIFPPKLALWILSFLLHRIKAYLKRKLGYSPPHFKVVEPQRSFNPHFHIIIFGIDFVMPKEQLTAYLEKHLVNFLSNLGKHYKRTINKGASETDVLALNLLSQVFIKKYYKYKKKRPRYAGPVNYITKVKDQEGTLIFENPPPSREKSTMHDGGNQTVWDYIKFYMVKNISLCDEEEAPTNYDVKKAKRKNDFRPFYWLWRLPFYTVSPQIRPPKKPKPPASYKFIGVFTEEELANLNLLEQLSVEVICPSPF